MNAFEFATAGRILFGTGRLREVGGIARTFGSRALVVTGRNVERASRLLDLLTTAGVFSETYPVAGEPTIDTARTGARAARNAGIELVIGYGGGSAIDCAKAIAAFVTNVEDPLDYLEIVGAGRPLEHPSAPCIAIPTTAGTGAEVTRNAVLGATVELVKVSLRGATILPNVALIDPETTLSMPAHVTAASGLDALTQLIEPFVSVKANAFTDLVCRDGITRVARSLRRAFDSPDDFAAREEMALASLYGGLALANAKLGAVHGFAGPLGGMLSAPHGELCGRLLPIVMRVNVNALRERAPNSEALARYDEIARLLTGDPSASADDGVAWAETLRDELGMRPLSAFAADAVDADEIVTKARASSSMQGNPIELTETELREIVGAAA